MNIFDSIKKLDTEVQEELSSLENEYDSNEYEIEKTADEAVDKFLDILEKSLEKNC